MQPNGFDGAALYARAAGEYYPRRRHTSYSHSNGAFGGQLSIGGLDLSNLNLNFGGNSGNVAEISVVSLLDGDADAEVLGSGDGGGTQRSFTIVLDSGAGEAGG